MTKLKQILMSPIRFYPDLGFGNATTFQNPDNRVSHRYNWENVNPIPYALPIPKQWPDGQPGIDFVINRVRAEGTFYAKLYDEDDEEYKDLYVDSWEVLNGDEQHRVWLDGVSGTGIADGFYTIKLFATSGDTLLLESEPLIIGNWFDDMIPFECWNFENDFGVVWDNGVTLFTSRMMLPIRMYDPAPEFEKEVYKDDPGILTTLRTTIQRAFNFDSLPVQAHVSETVQMAFANSELYLDRIKINSEDTPEAELIEGSGLKQLTGKATLVDFNDEYIREKVETEQTDQNIDWASGTYGGMVITDNSVSIDDAVVAGNLLVQSDPYSYSEGDLILVKVVLTDDGSSDLPLYSFGGSQVRLFEWGTHWFSFRVNSDSSDIFILSHRSNERAVYTAVITLYSIDLV